MREAKEVSLVNRLNCKSRRQKFVFAGALRTSWKKSNTISSGEIRAASRTAAAYFGLPRKIEREQKVTEKKRMAKGGASERKRGKTKNPERARERNARANKPLQCAVRDIIPSH